MIRFDNVWKRYGRTVALRGVSFVAPGGALTVLRGANGSGKSTILRLASGIALPDRGRVELAAGVRTYLGHEPQLIAHVPVIDNLRQQLALVGCPWARAQYVADRLGVDHFWHKPVQALSRGMLQRVLLVRALAPEAAMLLLDEPDTGLDAHGVDVVTDLIGERLAAGACVLAALHTNALDALRAPKTIAVAAGRVGGQADAA